MTKEANFGNYMMFALLDIVEGFLKMLKAEYGKSGIPLKPHHQMLFNQLQFVVTDLRRTTILLSEESQLEFGDFADNIKKLIMLTMDRCGENDKKFDLIINFIESINSEMGLRLSMYGI